jgi:hydroxyacylglutathione hydrolase
MKIKPIRALKDNYIWMITDQYSSNVWLVDPGEAHNALAILQKNHLELQGIFITHHHYDHCGGIAELLNYYPNVLIYGSNKSEISYINKTIGDGEIFDCLSAEVRVLEIPGHTLDHVAYLVNGNLFCGDTLFSVGCGKIFEGTAAQMYHSLNKLCQLDDDTKIYCGHEYTLANLKFALLVEPSNEYLQAKLIKATQVLHDNGCTLPSFLAEERLTNPFLRCTTPEIMTNVSKHVGKNLTDPVEVFYHLREWKNKRN